MKDTTQKGCENVWKSKIIDGYLVFWRDGAVGAAIVFDKPECEEEECQRQTP